LKEYPKIIRYKSYTYSLIDININYEQYIILDYVVFDDEKKKCLRKGCIITKVLDDQIITFGRTHSNTIRLKDISVSRNHCFIFKKDNRFYLQDKGSKFGSLFFLSNPYSMTSNKEETLCSGKVLLTFSLSKKSSFLSSLFVGNWCCSCKNKEEEFTINFQKDKYLEYENDKNKGNLNNRSIDSYNDNVLILDTIIRINEENN